MMREPPREGGVQCLGSRGFHRMHYYEWGDPANPRILVCVHGLTRNARDFDHFAHALSADYRVVCPDIVGRGRSDRLEAKTDYGYVQYVSDVTTLVARVTGGQTTQVDWVGTSMGALLGLVMAALARNPIRRLVLNDAGMLVPKAALERLASYVGKEAHFSSLDEAEWHMRRVCAPFGPLTDAQWRHLTFHGAYERDDGTWGLRYDPAIAQVFEGGIEAIDLSAQWAAVSCPTLIVRGAESDVLLRETAEEMTRRGPQAELVEFEGIGHAPMLMDDAQVRVVRDFLMRA